MNIRTIEGISFKIVIPFHVLENTALMHLHRGSKRMEELDGAMKLLTNSQNDNPRFSLDLDGYLHSIGIYESKDAYGNPDYHLHIWDVRGTISLYSKKIKKAKTKHRQYNFDITVIDPEQLKELKKILRAWNRDSTVSCTKCGRPHNNLSNQYFAGVYCNTCWEGGIKQQEARETYE